MLAQADNSANGGSDSRLCSCDGSPYREFDFVVGEWIFYTLDGTAIGKQSYTKREQGCLILEEWKLNPGETGRCSIKQDFLIFDQETEKWKMLFSGYTRRIEK